MAGAVACSSDSAVEPGNTVADSEIDQTVAADVGESFADNASQFAENESFQENMSAGSSTFMARQAGRGCGHGLANGNVRRPGRQRLVRLRRVHEPRAHDHAPGALLERRQLRARLEPHAHRLGEPSLDAHGNVRVAR